MQIKQMTPAEGWRALYVTRDDRGYPDMAEFPLAFWALLEDGRVRGFEARSEVHPTGEEHEDFICYLGPGDPEAGVFREQAFEQLEESDARREFERGARADEIARRASEALGYRYRVEADGLWNRLLHPYSLSVDEAAEEVVRQERIRPQPTSR